MCLHNRQLVKEGKYRVVRNPNEGFKEVCQCVVTVFSRGDPAVFLVMPEEID